MGRRSGKLRFAAGAAVVVAGAGVVLPANAQVRHARHAPRHVSRAAAVPAVAPPGAARRARLLDKRGRPMATAASSCKPVSLPDNPHYSSGDVSGHGQWNKGTCTSNTATVWNCIYEYYTDGSWRRKACSNKVVLKPKSQSNNRTTARRACDATNRLISWRNYVDVDVNGQSDPPDEPYRQADVDCVVTGPDR